MSAKTSATEGASSPKKPNNRQPEQLQKPKKQFRARELTILASVIVCAAIFGILNPRFLGITPNGQYDTGPAIAMLMGVSIDGLILIGMTIVIICGGFDLSVGSTMAAGGLVTALLLKAGTPVYAAVFAGLITGLIIGYINGLVITRLKVNPFITTLGTMSILRGFVLVITKNNPPGGFPMIFRKIAEGEVFGIPIPVIILIAAIIFADIMLRHMKYLRQTYFVGSNEDAAALTGINVGAVKTFAFVLTGVLAALAGIIVAARGNSIDPNEGMGTELRVIAAVIVGGASLSGGRGTILGAFLGLLLMQIITTGLVFIGVAPEAQMIAVGLVLILAAMIDQAGSSFGKNLAALLTQTRSKKLERAINVVLGLALIAVILTRFGSGGDTQSNTPGAVHTAKQKYKMIAIATGLSYWIDGKAGLMDKAEELGVKAYFDGPTGVDANQQIDAVERAIAEGVDGIILVPASDNLSTVIDKAIDKGIPVVCVDTDAPSSKRYSFIGTGNYNAGFQGGECLGKIIKGKGKVAILTVPGQDNLNQRVKGYRDALKKYPGVEVIQEVNTMSSTTEGQKACTALIQANPDLTALACVEAAGGQAAAVAVKQAGKVGKIKIVAMDRDEPTIRAIEEGIIDASIGQRSYSMTYTGLQMLYNIRNDQVKLVDDWRSANIVPLPPAVDTGSFVITRENASQFYHKKDSKKDK
ncbi:MAG: ABC transporter permease/substrate-binding protein [Armatimonadota bacterium]